MVQTVYYYLDSYSESRHYNNAIKQYTAKNICTKNTPSNTCIDPSKLKGKKNHNVRLQPLIPQKENNVVQNTSERKFSHQLNPLPNKSVTSADHRKLCSKIPVLQRKLVGYPKRKNDDVYWDATLSAADRRQKFHQSRLGVGEVCTNNIPPVITKQVTAAQYDVFPKYEDSAVKRNMAPSKSVVNQKNILPPIKPVDISTGSLQKVNQPKTKCLLGEITHFPALCNPLGSRFRKSYISTVPHLPPILPPPAAPPPSISTSLEKDGNQMNQRATSLKKNEEWNSSLSAFQTLIAV